MNDIVIRARNSRVSGKYGREIGFAKSVEELQPDIMTKIGRCPMSKCKHVYSKVMYGLNPAYGNVEEFQVCKICKGYRKKLLYEVKSDE